MVAPGSPESNSHGSKPITPKGVIEKRENDRLAAYMSDLESVSLTEEDEDEEDGEGAKWVYLHDAQAVLRQYAEQEPREGATPGGSVTWVWPHEASRRAPTDVRLRMPMDLPVFGELKRPGANADKGYVFTLDAFAWGRLVHVKLVGDDITVYVADAQRTRKVYTGKRRDDGDIHRHASGR